MSFNPQTLQEETKEEQLERQRQTGVIGNGLTVICSPTEDPEVTQVQSRVVCLTQPYQACHTCRHGTFTLVFNGNAQAKFERVLCPKWLSEKNRLEGEQPTDYVETEVATCKGRPFEFCPSCPSKEELSKMGVDKTKSGWYARFKRFSEDDE